MNHEHATADGTSTDRDGEQSSSESRDESPTGVGITDEDMTQIRSFLQKQRHNRTVDDLRPPSEQ